MVKNRKEIQRIRMWRYFVDAATDLIDEEGIDKLTVRKIADKAGYTSSTVYNYFKDLHHLKFFVSLRYTKSYVEELPNYINRGSNVIDRWLYSWDCFCKHSFDRPEIYSVIFKEDLGTVPEEILKEYYTIYSSDLIDLPDEIRSIIVEQSFSKRSSMFIKRAVSEGFFETEEDVSYISDVTLMIWKGVMNTYMNQRREYTKEEASNHALRLLYETIMRSIVPEKREEIKYKILGGGS